MNEKTLCINCDQPLVLPLIIFIVKSLSIQDYNYYLFKILKQFNNG